MWKFRNYLGSIVEIQMIKDHSLKQDDSIGNGENQRGIREFAMSQYSLDFEIHCTLDKLVDLYFRN